MQQSNPITWLLSLALTAIFSLVSVTAYSGDRPNLLIMGEDADEDTVPRDSRVFKRVLNEVSNQLHDMGFDVYDETAVTLDNFVQGRVRRKDSELIDIARSIRKPPLDVVVLFSIYASAKNTAYTTKIRSRIEGRMLQVNSGQRLGNIDLKTPNEWTAPAKCNRECIVEKVGEYSKIIAADIGAVLAEKLAYMVDGTEGHSDGSGNGSLTTAYDLEFENFTPGDMMNVEEYLVIFSGYKTHRPTYTSLRRAEYWYESTIKSAKLNRNLNKVLEELGLRGRITFSGNKFNIKKIVMRGNQTPKQDDGW